MSAPGGMAGSRRSATSGTGYSVPTASQSPHGRSGSLPERTTLRSYSAKSVLRGAIRELRKRQLYAHSTHCRFRNHENCLEQTDLPLLEEPKCLVRHMMDCSNHGHAECVTEGPPVDGTVMLSPTRMRKRRPAYHSTTPRSESPDQSSASPQTDSSPSTPETDSTEPTDTTLRLVALALRLTQQLDDARDRATQLEMRISELCDQNTSQEVIVSELQNRAISAHVLDSAGKLVSTSFEQLDRMCFTLPSTEEEMEVDSDGSSDAQPTARIEKRARQVAATASQTEPETPLTPTTSPPLKKRKRVRNVMMQASFGDDLTLDDLKTQGNGPPMPTGMLPVGTPLPKKCHSQPKESGSQASGGEDVPDSGASTKDEVREEPPANYFELLEEFEEWIYLHTMGIKRDAAFVTMVAGLMKRWVKLKKLERYPRDFIDGLTKACYERVMPSKVEKQLADVVVDPDVKAHVARFNSAMKGEVEVIDEFKREEWVKMQAETFRARWITTWFGVDTRAKINIRFPEWWMCWAISYIFTFLCYTLPQYLYAAEYIEEPNWNFDEVQWWGWWKGFHLARLDVAVAGLIWWFSAYTWVGVFRRGYYRVLYNSGTFMPEGHFKSGVTIKTFDQGNGPSR